MKSNGKKIIAVISAVLIVVILLFFLPTISKAFSKKETFKYVQNNQAEVSEIALGIINREIRTPYTQGKYEADYFSSSNEPIVEFYGYGFGLAPSGYYTGFYYSPNDIPVRFQGSGTAMEPYKNGWTYQEKGDNHGYTEKICDNWYWFEFYF